MFRGEFCETMTWILVVSPPRERPMQREQASFLGVAAILVNSDRGRTDHLDVAFTSNGYSSQYPRPMTGLAPAIEAVRPDRIRPVARRNIRPGRPRTQTPEFSV